MKTLKTFFLLLAMVVTSSSYAQTKEETIEWLNTNGLDFLFIEYYKANKGGYALGFKLLPINNDTLIYEKLAYGLTDRAIPTLSKVKLNSTLYQDVETVPVYQYEPNYYSNLYYFKVKTSGFSYKYDSQSKEEEYKDLSIYFKKDNEENAKRVLKAIMHLAKLSGAKENKQTF